MNVVDMLNFIVVVSLFEDEMLEKVLLLLFRYSWIGL